MVGAVRSTFTGPAATVLVLPATSVACPLTDWFAPWPSVVGALHVASPDSASEHANETATGTRNQLFAFGVALSEAEIVGGVLSMLTTVDTEALFPALSDAVPDTCCAAPSFDTVCGDEHVAMPETVSVHVNVTVTLFRFQPAAFGSGVSAAVIVGPVLSMRTATVWVASTFPATSVLAYVSVWTPSVENVALVPCVFGPPSVEYTVCATPERLSFAVKVTVTSLFVNDDDTSDAVVTGAVRSTFTGGLEAVVALPARSSNVRDCCWALPSLAITLFAGQVAGPTPDRLSAHVQCNVTAVLYQPAAFEAVVGAADSVGGVLSTLIPLTVAADVLPAWSAACPVT